MKKIILLLVVLLWAVGAQAGEVKILAVVVDGKIQSTGNYFASGGDNPFFENRYQSDYYGKGTVGLGITSQFAGGMQTQEQFEIQSGFGKFLTKAGTDSLINITNEETLFTTGTLTQNAMGFGGVLNPGIVTTTFSTDNGLLGAAEAQGVGTFKAGAIQTVITGTNEPGKEPQKIEDLEIHVKFDGQFQAQVGFEFPK